MNLLAWFAKNPVAANVLMVLILVGGLASLPVIKKEVRPPVALDQIEITVSYPGAAPSDVEQALCIPMEEVTRELDEIKKITSEAQEGSCQMVVEVVAGGDTGGLLAAIKRRVDNIETWPSEVEPPIYQERYGDRRWAAVVSVHGPTDRLILRQWAQKVGEGLLALPEVSEARLIAVPDYELAIEVAPRQLWRYGLTLDDIAEAVAKDSLDLPGGEVKTSAGEILLRHAEQAYSREDFEAIVLRADQEGTRLTLGQVATVRDGLAEQEVIFRFDGEPSISIDVYPTGQIPAMVEAVRDYVVQMSPRLPEGVQLTIWDEADRNFNRLAETLKGSALIGFCLVLTLLCLFLGWRLAWWASLGVLISFFGTLALMPWLGLSLNTYTIYAFILVLGIVVDDTIVIGENIHRHQQQGHSGLVGALRGTRELAPLVILMVLTTMVAFLPGWLLPGVEGRVIGNLALVVILTLLFSLVDALLILPAHLAHHRAVKKQPGPLSRVPVLVGAGLDWLMAKVYRPLLAGLLGWRYATLAGFGAALAIALSPVLGGHLPVVPKQHIPSTFTVAYARFPADRPYEDLVAFAGRMERAFGEIRAELDAGRPAGEPSVFRHVNNAMRTDTIYIIVELRDNQEAARRALPQILERWRERIGSLPDGVHLSFFYAGSYGMDNQLAGGAPKRPVDLQVTAADLDTLRLGAEALAQALAAHPGLYNVSNSYQPGKPELRFHLTPEGRHLGLTPEDLARQVRQAFYGREAQRFFRGRDEIKVMVRYPQAERRDLNHLYDLPVRLPNGQTVPFSRVAEWSFAPGAATITRQDRKRVLRIGADVVGDNEAAAETILQDLQRQLFPQLEQRFPGLAIELGEERQEQSAAMATLARYAGLALLVIYALLAVALRSYVRPLLVMAVIPFSFIGVVAGHLLLGVTLTLYSLVALLAVAGVVVNDSLVLIDRIHRNEATEENRLPALLQAGQARFRPILLTTLTTFLGLMPILWEQGAEAERVIPMAVTLAFGVLFSTLVTLVLVPVGYLIFADIQRGIRRWGKMGLPWAFH